VRTCKPREVEWKLWKKRILVASLLPKNRPFPLQSARFKPGCKNRSSLQRGEGEQGPKKIRTRWRMESRGVMWRRKNYKGVVDDNFDHHGGKKDFNVIYTFHTSKLSCRSDREVKRPSKKSVTGRYISGNLKNSRTHALKQTAP